MLAKDRLIGRLRLLLTLIFDNIFDLWRITYQQLLIKYLCPEYCLNLALPELPRVRMLLKLLHIKFCPEMSQSA